MAGRGVTVAAARGDQAQDLGFGARSGRGSAGLRGVGTHVVRVVTGTGPRPARERAAPQ